MQIDLYKITDASIGDHSNWNSRVSKGRDCAMLLGSLHYNVTQWLRKYYTCVRLRADIKYISINKNIIFKFKHTL